MRCKLSAIFLLLVFIYIPRVKAQVKGDSAVEVLVMRAQEDIDVTTSERPCMSASGNGGCYLVVLRVPDGYSITYANSTLQEISSSLAAQLLVESFPEGYTVFIPSEGGLIHVNDTETGNSLLTHAFPPDKPGQRLSYRVTVNKPDQRQTIRPRGIQLGGVSVSDSTRSERSNASISGDSADNLPATDRQDASRQGSRGQLLVESDVDADIWIEGRKIEQGIVQHLEPGVYTVTLNHATGEKQLQVTVRGGERVRLYEQLKPSRSTTALLGLLFPGAGHSYIGNNRGGVYTMLGIVGIISTVFNYRDDNHEVGEYSLMATLGIHGISLLDLSLTSPAYGYKDNSSRARLLVSPISATNHGFFSPSLQLAIRF